MDVLHFDSTEKSKMLALKYGYDEWIVSRFLEFVPDINGLLEYMEGSAPRYIRCNILKIGTNELRGRLTELGFVLHQTILPEVFKVISEPLPLGATSEYLQGYYYIQDLSSCIAVEALGVMPDECVLDMASSPGGKTTFIAQKMQNTGSIVCIENNNFRLRSLSFNLARCGVTNAIIYRIDGRDIATLNRKYDKILLDAPCSCEGIISKDHSRKTSRTPYDIDYCKTRQIELIKSSLKVIKPGGILVYSTCTFAPEENEFVINSIINGGNVSLESIGYGYPGLTKFGSFNFHPMLENASRFYPHIHDTAGFYIAKLRIH